MWSNFWDVLWFFFWTYAFIAYLMVLFSIVSDLFRDHTLNGWWKAVWIIFLLFLPFLTALVYLIARGKGMAERRMKSATDAEAATTQYIRTAAGHSPAEEISKAKSLLEAGTINQSEFDSLKARALS